MLMIHMEMVGMVLTYSITTECDSTSFSYIVANNGGETPSNESMVL